MLGRDASAHCAAHDRYGHSTANCQGVRKDYKAKGRSGGKSGKAMVAKQRENKEELFYLDANFDGYSSTASAQIAKLGSALSATAKPDPTSLVVDSGANEHFVSNSSLLSDYKPLIKPIEVEVGDGKHIEAIGKGVLTVGPLKIAGAYYTPRMAQISSPSGASSATKVGVSTSKATQPSCSARMECPASPPNPERAVHGAPLNSTTTNSTLIPFPGARLLPAFCRRRYKGVRMACHTDRPWWTERIIGDGIRWSEDTLRNEEVGSVTDRSAWEV
jgi:hypothetical protein